MNCLYSIINVDVYSGVSIENILSVIVRLIDGWGILIMYLDTNHLCKVEFIQTQTRNFVKILLYDEYFSSCFKTENSLAPYLCAHVDVTNLSLLEATPLQLNYILNDYVITLQYQKRLAKLSDMILLLKTLCSIE